MTALGRLLAREAPAGRPPLRPIDYGGLLLGLAAVTGVIAVLIGPEPALLVLGVIVGGVLLVTALLVPAVALTLLVVSQFSDASGVLAVPEVHRATLGIGVLSALIALRRPEIRARLLRLPVAPVALFACYVLSLMPALWFAPTPAASAAAVDRLLKDGAVLVIVLVLGYLVNRPWWIAAAIVATLAVLAALTLVNQIALGASPSTFGGFATVSRQLGEDITTPRHAGPIGDANFWGRMLVLGLPFAVALVHRSVVAGRRLPPFGWGLATVAMLGGIYLTQSRGAFLAAGVGLVVWVLASGPGVRRQAVRLAPLALVGLLIPGVGNRLLNLASVFEGGPAYLVDPSLVERAAVQRVAAIVFTDRPLFGTGPGSFPLVVHDYSSRENDLLIGSVTAPHNLYLEIAAESGLVGLTGWLILVIGVMVLSVRSLIGLAGGNQDGRAGAPTRALAAAVLAAVVGWSLASLFLHLAQFRPVLIVFALAGLLRCTTSDRATGPEVTARARAMRGLRRGSVVAVIIVLAATTAVAASWWTALSEQRYTARAQVTVLPAPGTIEPYSLDVRSRLPVLPAYASMIDSAGPQEETFIEAEPARGLITITAHGSDPEETGARVNQLIADAPQALARFGADRGFRLVQVSPLEITAGPAWSGRAVSIGALVALAVGGVLAAAAWHDRRHLWRADPSPTPPP
ncbi:MAG: O-antigen ligase family protein [Actinomycetota bacterium]|nr:O-antigen ligase family protein [Actinomycetota bacterium]